MTKRITALLVAVIVPIMLIFTGCGSKQLTVKEYYDELYADYKQYVADLKEITTLQTDAKTIAAVQSQLKKATEICEKAEKTLDKFADINPPSEFADKHKKLLSAVELEKKFLKATAKVFTAKNENELVQYTKDVEAVFNGTPTDKQFASVFMDLILEAKAAADKEK